MRSTQSHDDSIALPSAPLLLPSSLPTSSPSRSTIPLLVPTPPRSLLLLIRLLRSPVSSTLPTLLLHRVLLPLSSSKLSAERKGLLLLRRETLSLRGCEALLLLLRLLVGEEARVEVTALDGDRSLGARERGGRGAAADGGRVGALGRRLLELLRVLRREVAELLLLLEAHRRRCEGRVEAALLGGVEALVPLVLLRWRARLVRAEGGWRCAEAERGRRGDVTSCEAGGSRSSETVDRVQGHKVGLLR